MGQGDKEKGGAVGVGVVRMGGEGCLHYLQVSSQVARRLTDFRCLALNLPALCSPTPALPPVHLSAAHVLSEHA